MNGGGKIDSAHKRRAHRRMRSGPRFCLACSLILAPIPQACAQSIVLLNPAHDNYPAPVDPLDRHEPDEIYDDSLADAIAEAYASNPGLTARRYDLRAIDDDIGIAMAQARPTAQAQIEGGYALTLPGDVTNAARSLSDRLNDPNVQKNDMTSQLVADQPLWTGGRVSSALRASTAASMAGRQSLRVSEGDLLLDLIMAYADIRRDTASLAIRQRNLDALRLTLDEIAARREAGELTRTDIAQGEVQLEAAPVQFHAAQAQLQASRAAFAAIVGREPRTLAPEPDLAGLPSDFDAAMALAETANPELAAAIADERASRARIAVAKAEGAPQISLRATAGTTGSAVPFDRRDHDVIFTGRTTLSIPLSAGGRVRALTAQARNRNAADQFRIEAARRQLVQTLVTVWNQWAWTEQAIAAQDAQLRAARIFFEGTYAEYREGLRSTFDVLYAQNAVRDAEIGLLASRRDRYVARAALLRRMGLLEVDRLLQAAAPYDPARYTARVRARGAVPWGVAIRLIDRIGAPGTDRPDIAPLPDPGQPADRGPGSALAPHLAPPGPLTTAPLPTTRVARPPPPSDRGRRKRKAASARVRQP